MKTKLFLTALLVLAFTATSCTDNPVNDGEKTGGGLQVGKKNTFCEFENPLTDLSWLKAEVNEIVLSFQAGNPLSVSIYQCIYGDGEIGFLMDKGNMKLFYNCSGEVLCIMGGHAGETCPGLNIISQKLIWTTCDLDVIISCEFENPLTDLNWLKSFIESDHHPSYRRIYQCTYKNGIGFLCETENLGYIFRGCHGAALCGELDGGCDRYNIDFENKQLIWEYSKTNN